MTAPSCALDPFDPMEQAFHRLAKETLAGTEHLHDEWQLVREYPLSSDSAAPPVQSVRLDMYPAAHGEPVCNGITGPASEDVVNGCWNQADVVSVGSCSKNAGLKTMFR